VAPLVFIIGLYYSSADLNLTSLIQIVLLSFPFSVILYGINDIYDYDSDKLNTRKKTLEFKEDVLHPNSQARFKCDAWYL